MNKKGFTLIELLVVVLIIGILAAMALPQYFKAVERSRMAEAVGLLGSIAQSQQRKFLQINKYAENFKGLDAAPKGANGSVYYTKGDPESGANGNGFAIELSGNAVDDGMATATRDANGNTLQYKYELIRYYASNGTACHPLEADDNGAALCADFCGINSLDNTKYCCNDGSTDDGGEASLDDLTGACTKPTAN
ncbi:MAG: prepilin-type N-terminal cleavage/methylation domain-containing protein [Elusimicrobiaceae bacterium]|nr:prepilin-type N-terminal cleavage/methylation domain-containing protein [Elusimicrobiaceae bacterium]